MEPAQFPDFAPSSAMADLMSRYYATSTMWPRCNSLDYFIRYDAKTNQRRGSESCRNCYICASRPRAITIRPPSVIVPGVKGVPTTTEEHLEPCAKVHRGDRENRGLPPEEKAEWYDRLKDRLGHWHFLETVERSVVTGFDLQVRLLAAIEGFVRQALRPNLVPKSRCSKMPKNSKSLKDLRISATTRVGTLAMRRWFSILLIGLIFSGPALAQEDKKTDDLKPADPDTGESTVEETTLGLLPNPFENRGIKFAVTYIGEVLGNTSGGLERGSAYEDRFNFALDADLEKMLGLKQLTFHANIFQIDGGGLSRGALYNFLVVSGIEALPTTRLYEIWFEQKWGNKVALRAGQLAADTEFMTAKYTDVFTNASLGWPAGLSLNLPSGGPSPPLAAMGARVRADVSDNLSLLGAVFDGDAAGPGQDDPQLRNRYGVNFRVNDPPLVLGEAQFLWNSKKGDPGLDGKFKIGGWRHFGDFADERFSANGSSLADPAASQPATRAGDYGVYAVFEQKVYRVGRDDDRGIGIFGRVTYNPPDRNLIDRYGDAGIEFVGLSDRRPKDKFGVAVAYAHVSARATALDEDFRRVYGALWPLRSSESLLTTVYQYEVRPGWSLQPNYQFIRHPGGGATDPLSRTPGKPLKDASVFGLRTVLKF